MSHVEKLARDIRTVWFVMAVAVGLYWVLPIGKDDTDPSYGRSGFRLLTDARTGCQYLSADGLTPRLDADGHHLGCRK